MRQWRYLYGVKLCIGHPIVCRPCIIRPYSQSIAHRPNLVQPIQGKTCEQIDMEDIKIYLHSVRDQVQNFHFSDSGVLAYFRSWNPGELLLLRNKLILSTPAPIEPNNKEFNPNMQRIFIKAKYSPHLSETNYLAT